MITIAGKSRAKRFWRTGHNACGKWSLNHGNLEHFTRKGAPQSLLPLNATGKFRQKLINGLYESLCYSPRHALDFQPNNSDEFHGTSPLTITVQRHTSPEKCYPSGVCENLTTIDRDETLLSTWHRTNSWSTSASCANSSGYSSANTSCPSSANSHRSTSPTPDFSNIKLLSATLEQYSGEDNSYAGDSDLEILNEDDDLRNEFSAEPYDFFATWPRKNNIQERDNDRLNKKIFSGELFSLFFCRGFDIL